MTLTTITINTVDYQTYASVAEADAYLAVDPTRATDWALLTVDQKGANLVAATRRLDLESYSGEKVVATQTTEWFRTGATCDGVAIADDVIPQELEDATALLAGSITLDATASAAGSGPSNIREVQSGTTRVEFFRPQTSSSFALSEQHPDIFALINCLLDGSRTNVVGQGGSVAFGTDGESQFETSDPYGLREGWP